MAAQSRGSVKVLVQPLKLSLLAMATVGVPVAEAAGNALAYLDLAFVVLGPGVRDAQP